MKSHEPVHEARIALVDYGIGNLRSVQKALEAAGGRVILTADPAEILAADKVVLPGVGAFGDGMLGLRSRNLETTIRTVFENGTAMLGICLGMQLLFETSEEQGNHNGLGIIPGRVLCFNTDGYKVPQTGWNQVLNRGQVPLLEGLDEGSYAYFNHAYYCEPESQANVAAITEYGIRYASVVVRERLYGVQFHPEKSQDVGLKILRNFVEKC